MIQVDVDYLLSSVEKIGLLQLEILDIYDKCIDNKNFKNHTFQNIFQEILQVDIPKIFLNDALQYLNKEKILINNSKKLISLPLKDFHIESKLVATILKNKELYSDPQSQNISLYYNPFSKEFIPNNSSQLYETGDVIDGKNFLNTNINDNDIIACIERNKPKETSFFRDGVEIKIILKNSKKRKVLYARQSIDYKFTHKEKNSFDIVFADAYKFMDNYKDKFIEQLIRENKLLLELRDDTISISQNKHIEKNKTLELVLTDIENIEDKVNSQVYVVFGKKNSDPIKLDHNRIKYMINHEYIYDQNSYRHSNTLYDEKTVFLDKIKYNIPCQSYVDDDNYKQSLDSIADFIINSIFKNIKHYKFEDDLKLLGYIENFTNKVFIKNKFKEALSKIDLKDIALKKFILILKHSNFILDKATKEDFYKIYIASNNDYVLQDYINMLKELKINEDNKIINTIFSQENKLPPIVQKESNTISIKKVKTNKVQEKKTIPVRKNNYIPDIPNLSHKVISLISDINDTQLKINHEEVFITNNNNAKSKSKISIECSDEDSFQLFATALWLVLKDGSQHKKIKYKNLPKKFTMKHKFFRLLDNTRHHHGGHNLDPEGFGMTREDIWKELKGDILIPKDEEWALMQSNLLKKAEAYLEELDKYKRTEFKKLGYKK